MSFRKEIKFHVHLSEIFKFKEHLFVTGLRSLYPDRKIISCYFDTIDHQFFWDSEEGLLPRKKIRIRWYNDDLNYTKEIKISSIEGRYKYIDHSSNYDSTTDIAKVRIFDTDHGILFPSLIVTYFRQYYEYSGLRLTFDSNISYSKPNNNVLLSFKDSHSVIEVKASFHADDDYIQSILPYSTSRFSKYSRGLQFFL